MSGSVEPVRVDFDRIAVLEEPRWDHNSHYHGSLLRRLPECVGDVLDIGSGTGTFARLLAPRARSVLGVDLSPQMVRIARERSVGFPNVEYRADDVRLMDLPRGSFDAVVSIATFHHLPLRETLARVRDTLRPGGVLAVLDLYRSEMPRDLPVNLLAVPLNLVMMPVRTGRFRPSAERRAAWDAHGAHDSYLSLREVRRTAAEALGDGPGRPRVRRHLFWRYSLVWRKPKD